MTWHLAVLTGVRPHPNLVPPSRRLVNNHMSLSDTPSRVLRVSEHPGRHLMHVDNSRFKADTRWFRLRESRSVDRQLRQKTTRRLARGWQGGPRAAASAVENRLSGPPSAGWDRRSSATAPKKNGVPELAFWESKRFAFAFPSCPQCRRYHPEAPRG